MSGALQSLQAWPITWLLITLAAYVAAVALYRRSGSHPLLIPVLTGVTLVVALLLLTGTSYETYSAAAQPLTLLIGPATVALAVPLFAQRQRIRRLWRPLAIALLCGCTAAIVSALGLAWALGGTRETLLSLAPKSATMPIALPVAEQVGGLPSLTAVGVALTGIAGAVLASPLARLLGTQNAAVRGFASGVTAHAIGTARELQNSPTAGAFAALGMGLNGVATAVMTPLFIAALGWL
ncbi:TIGR00659 family protein [Oryzisolibacter propanilivorax]|uniref:TIGR00659 family protein n=1 Tax=Oryzisolibacter propanilivorax TaxID=1527607 RepID=A0A1G9TZ23_9BURK|nr:LrgB family protein [Oryzisolibacter propanilivorax]SDM52922.1 TIGR00659 family protein [Oryzisolibacter propanilivorax]